MALTIGNWILFIIFLIATIIIALCIFFNYDDYGYNVKGLIITLIIGFASSFIYLYSINYYHTQFASGIRSYKEYTINKENGILREIVITAEDGREIYYFKGKVDIETDPEKNYILFEDEDNIRHIIYYGITDTIMITELHE